MKNKKFFKIIFIDVKYRNVSEPVKRKKVLRYGICGKILYRIGSRIFSLIYPFLKISKLPYKLQKDYFLLIAKF